MVTAFEPVRQRRAGCDTSIRRGDVIVMIAANRDVIIDRCRARSLSPDKSTRQNAEKLQRVALELRLSGGV
jgi:hypothetical protein